MPTLPPRDRLFELGAGLLALAAAAPIVWMVGKGIAVRRDYPGDLEWMEGATLISAQRVQQGLPLYGEPAPDYIPFIYPPLHAWVLGLLGSFSTLDYTLGRTLSGVCTVLAALALVFGARREGASWPFALATVGLFASAWDNGGTFYDLVRTDALSLAIVSWSLVIGAGRSRGEAIASGLLLALAFTAKQHAALLGIPMLAWHWRTGGRERALAFAVASVGPALLFLLAMSVATGGSFLTWLILVPLEHGGVAERYFPGAQKECWSALPVVTTAVLLAPLWIGRRGYWAGVALTTLVTVSIMRGHTGGYLNVLIPMMWVQSLLPVVAASAVGGRWAQGAAGLLVAAQLLYLGVDLERFWKRVERGQSLVAAYVDAQETYARFLPSSIDRENHAALIAELRELPDPILIPHHPWYAVQAGKRTSFALITLWDIDHKGGVYASAVPGLDRAMASEFASAVMPDDKLGHGFKDAWALNRPLRTRPPLLRTGWPVKLKTIWRLKGASQEEAASPAPTPDQSAE